MPNGDLAYDLTVRILDPLEGRVLVPDNLEVRPTLAGPKITQTDFLRVPLDMLAPDIRRRLETIALREEEGHRGAINDILNELCELRAENWFENMPYEEENRITELGWLQEHKGGRRERGEAGW